MVTKSPGQYSCGRCSGQGRIRAFSHVLGGVCLKCHGTGRVETKPAAKPLFAVYLIERNTGNAVHIYNFRARTAGEALRRAQRTYERASNAFRDEHTMIGAVAEQTED